MRTKTYALEIWTVGATEDWIERIAGAVWSGETEGADFDAWFDYVWTFVGKLATVRVGTNDYDINRDQALDFASKFMKGELNFRFVDFMTGKAFERGSAEITDHPHQ